VRTINKNLLSPCGLYCGMCPIYVAHRDGNDRLKEKLAKDYGMKPEEISCRGCLSNELFGHHCRVCSIRSCAGEKSYEGCHQCSDFPCEHINKFPFEDARQIMLAAIPQWRSLGTEKWITSLENQHRCKKCGAPFTRGARRCCSCKEPVE
jgi:hypothetical protein